MYQRGEACDPQDTPDVGAYEYKETGPAPASGSGGGGCSAGFAPAVLFLALPLFFLKTLKDRLIGSITIEDKRRSRPEPRRLLLFFAVLLWVSMYISIPSFSNEETNELCVNGLRRGKSFRTSSFRLLLIIMGNNSATMRSI
ncbi:MAG: hypothetical protein CSA35_04240 [Dethiosulfovibrio peptidovorans]|nr:MAG: hypothetical protein CSA35_04240 [Dethiosulfovibrio peptidovorans]